MRETTDNFLDNLDNTLAWVGSWAVADEKRVRAQFERVMGRYFALRPEVQMRHWSGERIRIDYIGIPMIAFQRGCVGFEIKAEFDGFKDISRALKQGIDYRQSEIIDKRFKTFPWKVPNFVFLFNPFWANRYQSMLGGALRLAGLWNVGIAEPDDPWEGLKLVVSDSTLWSEKSGLRAYGWTFGTSRGTGSKS